MQRSWKTLVWLLVANVVYFCQSPKVLGQVDRDSNSESPVDEKDRAAVDDDAVSINCTGRIERRLDEAGNQIYFVEVTPPVLEGSRKYKLNLSIVNPYDEPIKYSKVSLTCGCAKFEVKGHEIPALAAADFVMHIDVPNQIAVPFGRVIATFLVDDDSGSKSVLRVAVTYALHGVFGFNREREIIELPKTESIAVLKLPIILVEPMTLEKLELKFTDNMRDCEIEVISDDPQASTPYVKIQVPRLAVPRQGITTEVGLRRKGSNQVAGVMVSIKHKEAFALRPESLRLSRDNHSKPYKATALLRIVPPVESPDEVKINQKGGSEKNVELPRVALTIGGQPAKVVVQRMGQSELYRLTMQSEGPFQPDSNGTLDVRWKIEFRGEVHEISSYAFISEN
jgi:hypothetical protein